MYCSTCGVTVAARLSYCNHCGAKLSRGQSAWSGGDTGADATEQRAGYKRTRRRASSRATATRRKHYRAHHTHF